MAAQQRKLLERLMGSADGPSDIDFADPRLCKAYCVDFCVSDLLAGTKAGIGPCPYVHIERAQMLYRARAPIPSFEREFDRSVQRAAAAARRRVAAAEQGLDEPPGADAELRSTVAALGDELAAAGRRGDISAEVIARIENLEARRAELRRADAGPQRLQVCRVCAAYLSPAESDQRLADHFTGKYHRACAQVFAVLEARSRAVNDEASRSPESS